MVESTLWYSQFQLTRILRIYGYLSDSESHVGAVTMGQFEGNFESGKSGFQKYIKFDLP